MAAAPGVPGLRSPSTDWAEVPPEAELYSWTVVHRSPLPAFADLAPYAVVVAELEREPVLRLLGRLVPDADPAALRIGMALRVEFERVSDAVALPLWRPIA